MRPEHYDVLFSEPQRAEIVTPADEETLRDVIGLYANLTPEEFAVVVTAEVLATELQKARAEERELIAITFDEAAAGWEKCAERYIPGEYRSRALGRAADDHARAAAIRSQEPPTGQEKP